MVKLENVAIEELRLSYFSPELLYKLIKEENITNIQEFIDYINKHPELLHPIKDREIFDLINVSKKMVEKHNKLGIKPEIYPIKEYLNRELEYNDKLNNFSVLPIINPLLCDQSPYERLGNIKIEDIKRYLTQVNSRGENFFRCNASAIGVYKIKRILETLNIYTEQIETQANLTSDRSSNILLIDSLEKKEIAFIYYKLIIEYLIDNYDELIWGELSDSQRKRLISSANKENITDVRVRNKIIEYLTNYLTLVELKDISKGNYRSLNKFSRKK